MRHTVRQGECILSIADLYGFRDWKAIYDDPANEDLRKQRPDPAILAPGDLVVIPKRPVGTRAVSVAAGQRHAFKAELPALLLRLVIQDHEGHPLANKPYELELGSKRLSGTTDGGGVVEQELDSTCKQGSLTVWLRSAGAGPYLHWNLGIGHIDPIETITGIQGRLANLGFSCGAVDGVPGRRTRAALRAFQKQAGLRVTGKPDAGTKQKLVDLHGC